MPKQEAIAAAPGRIEALAREATEATKAADVAKRTAATAAREMAALTVSLHKLQALKTRADRDLDSANKAVEAAKTEEAKARAEALQQKATARVAELGTELDAAQSAVASKPTTAAAKDAAKAAAAKQAAAAKAALDAKLALEPVSVYISRATQKLYVRRNTHKPAPDGGGEVFDATIEVPITIRNPERPIGTHVFTAMARNETGLRWSAVSVDGTNDAKDALDRITIPQDVLDRIAPTAIPRSSIVISDEPLSAETNYRTEFVVVLKDQPQGGFITRKPTPKVDVASRDVDYRDDGPFGGFFSSRNWGDQPVEVQRGGQNPRPAQRSWR